VAKTHQRWRRDVLAGFWIIEAADLDVALKHAAEESKACNRKVEVRRNAAQAISRACGR